MLARLGEHSGVVANALRNMAPSRASRSIFGVRENGCPAHPRSSQRRSSTRMKMMFGRVAGAAASVPHAIAGTTSPKIRNRVVLTYPCDRCMRFASPLNQTAFAGPYNSRHLAATPEVFHAFPWKNGRPVNQLRPLNLRPPIGIKKVPHLRPPSHVALPTP